MFSRVSPMLQKLHWLRVPESIQWRLCVLARRCVHGTAQVYLADCRRLCTCLWTRWRRRCKCHRWDALPSTTGRAFPVATARAWNSLPGVTRLADSLPQFHRETKAHLSLPPVVTGLIHYAADSLTYANNMQFIVFSAPAKSPMRQCHFNLCFSYHVPTVITVNINRKSHIRPISNGVISAVLFKGEYYSNRCILLYMYCPTTDNLFT